MNYSPMLNALLLNDALRMEALIALRHLHLPDGWIGAGFLRDAVWAHLHQHPQPPVPADVDVVWFDDLQRSEAQDRELESTLKRLSPAFNWSVKNQARMHRRNGDAPYCSTEDALRFWPETATAVAVRLTDNHRLETIAPMGLRTCLNYGYGPRRALSMTNARFSCSGLHRSGGWQGILCYGLLSSHLAIKQNETREVRVLIIRITHPDR